MIGVVAHDAGGAELISSYVRQQGLECLFTLSGPARSVVTRKLGAIEEVGLEELVDRCDQLLCGTSFLADVEWRALGLARVAGKRTVTFLDHWVNYRQRFERHGVWQFPDEVWVGDEIGLAIAKRELPEVTMRLVDNPFFVDVRCALATIARTPATTVGLRLLYVSEPLREDGLALYGDERYWGYTEEEAVTHFLSQAEVFGPVAKIVVRPHPQESADKYEWVKKRFAFPIETGRSRTLLEEIVDCDVVAGCATMAMVIGLLAGRRVVSCIPPGGRAEALPHPEIERIEGLVARAASEPRTTPHSVGSEQC